MQLGSLCLRCFSISLPCFILEVSLCLQCFVLMSFADDWQLLHLVFLILLQELFNSYLFHFSFSSVSVVSLMVCWVSLLIFYIVFFLCKCTRKGAIFFKCLLFGISINKLALYIVLKVVCETVTLILSVTVLPSSRQQFINF